MENFAILSGYITNDPETKTIPSGKTVIDFTLSVYAKFKKDGDKKHVSFFNCTYWPQEKPEGNIQREVAKLVKGLPVVFKAEPIQERWEKEGQKNSMVKWNVEGWVEVLKRPEKADDCPF